jgi:hypothetical protein
MCLACAVPVRGRVLGSECLAAELGADVPTTRPPERDPSAGAHRAVQLAFAAAVVATFLPWSRFGTGSAAFGAWTATPAWSTLAAAAGVAGLVLSFAGRWWRGSAGARDLATAVAGALVLLGSGLAIARPPAFTSPWLGPWVALAAGAIATAASLIARNREGIPEAAHV